MISRRSLLSRLFGAAVVAAVASLPIRFGEDAGWAWTNENGYVIHHLPTAPIGMRFELIVWDDDGTRSYHWDELCKT